MNLVKATGTIGGLTLVSRVAGFAREMLMSRVMDPAPFAVWFDAFLPASVMARFEPVEVSDRSDGKIAHLDGLNLSRGWCMHALAAAIAPSPRVAALEASALRHLDAALPHVAGDYMGEHWLATFALLAFCHAPVDAGVIRDRE